MQEENKRGFETTSTEIVAALGKLMNYGRNSLSKSDSFKEHLHFIRSPLIVTLALTPHTPTLTLFGEGWLQIRVSLTLVAQGVSIEP